MAYQQETIMKFHRRSIALASLCLGLGLASTAAQAQQKLLLNSFIGVNHPITTQIIKPWADDVAKATQGPGGDRGRPHQSFGTASATRWGDQGGI